MGDNKKKLLVVCDSHGTRWGACGYGELLKDRLEEFDVSLLKFGGVSLDKIYKDLADRNLEFYDVVILGVGNPDVHPRIPRYVRSIFRKIGFPIRDSYFCIPPFFCFSYFARIPTFLIKICLIRIWEETYLEKEEVVFYFSKIYDLVQRKSSKVLVVPLLTPSKIYGNLHNRNARHVNRVLSAKYKDSYLVNSIFNKEYYRRYYNKDFFHFTQCYQDDVYDLLKKKVLFY